MKKTVLLVQPGNQTLKPRLPINLLPLAYQLKKAGYVPEIIDLRFKDFEKFEIDWSKVLAVGISTYTGPMILQSLETAKKIRAIDKTMPLIWGGIHPSLIPEQTAEHPLVDFVVRKDGEETLVELVQAIEKKKPVDSIKGITYKKNGKVVSTPDREWFDLNKIKILPYDMVDVEKYNTAEFSLNTSRGCPFGCIFCYNNAYNQGSYRAKKPKLVVDELEYIVKKYKVDTFNFVDDNFFTDKKRVEEICKEIIKRKLKIKWTSTIRANYLRTYSIDFLKMIKKSGCYMFAFGAESGNARMLKVIGKGTTPEDNIEAVRKLKQVGIIGRASFVWGIPSETYAETLDSIEMMKEFKRINPEIVINGFFIATVYPNTRLFNKVLEIVPDFKMPQSLEEWGHWELYVAGFQPWLDKKYVDRMTTASEIVRFYCLKEMDPANYFRNPLVVLGVKLGEAIMSIPAAIRWKLNFFDFGIEWKLFNKLRYNIIGST